MEGYLPSIDDSGLGFGRLKDMVGTFSINFGSCFGLRDLFGLVLIGQI